jgi:hypothetical protein
MEAVFQIRVAIYSDEPVAKSLESMHELSSRRQRSEGLLEIYEQAQDSVYNRNLVVCSTDRETSDCFRPIELCSWESFKTSGRSLKNLLMLSYDSHVVSQRGAPLFVTKRIMIKRICNTTGFAPWCIAGNTCPIIRNLVQGSYRAGGLDMMRNVYRRITKEGGNEAGTLRANEA